MPFFGRCGSFRAMAWKLLLCALALISPSVAAAQPATDTLPELQPLWTIAADGCVSVHTDGEPWQECGFQSFTMNPEASRILTVSVGGVIQLWDGEGRELRRIDWADQPGGASGHPSARTAIVGSFGLAVTHQNQLTIIDVSDGRILQQRVLDLMTVENLRALGDRVFAETKNREWKSGVVAIQLPSGDVEPMAGFRDFMRFGPGYHVTGERAPFTIHFLDGRPPLQSQRSCMPHSAEYCSWRETGEPVIHLLDLRSGNWTSYDFGRPLDERATVHVHVVSGRPYALLCESRGAPVRDCSIIDMEARQELHRFPSDDWQVDIGRDERGMPELRVRVHTDPNPYGGLRSIRGVAVDGRVREIDPTGRVRLGRGNGIMLLPVANEQSSIMVGPSGRAIGRLPFLYYHGYGQLVGRRWLVPVARPGATFPAGGLDGDTALAMYELPR